MSTNAANDRRNDEPDALLDCDFASEPLSLFEEYMLTDNSPQYRMEPAIYLYFRGTLNREVARRTFHEVLKRHPFLRSRVEKRRGRFFWVPSETPPEVLFVDYDLNPKDVFNESGCPRLRPIKIFVEPGFRIYYIESKRENWTRLVLQFHHSVADGIGMLQALDEWLTLYAREVGDVSRDTTLPELNQAALAERRRIGWKLRSYLRNYCHTGRTTRQYLLCLPRPLVSVGAFNDVEPENDSPYMATTKLSRAETTAYLRRAKTIGATVNDALLADCFRAIDKWLTDVMHDEKNGRMRVMAPINMRTANNLRAPLSNVVSTVFIDRSRRKSSVPGDSLLKSVVSEMQWVKKKDQRYVFLLILRILRCIPGSLKLALRSSACRSTCVLSNLGRVLEASSTRKDENGRVVLGDATLERVEAEAPIRYKTALSVVGLTYAGELNLCVHYDSRLITNDQAREFARIYRELLL